MTVPRILLLEDDPNLGMVIRDHLQLNGYEVVLCPDGVAGLEASWGGAFDLCLVDVMMPKKDGFTFARELRTRDSRTPLIFLTAKSLKEDKIEGFRIGCDDYLTKPFSVEELLLRIQAVLRRVAPMGVSSSFRLGQYLFDAVSNTLTRKGDSVRLTPREAEVLKMLCQHRNQILAREQLLKQLWGDDSYFNSRSLDVFISKLRKHLSGDPRIEILGLHGRGFRLVAPE